MALPDLIGRYRLESQIGSGGFAVVWRAHDETLDTTIAIKIMAEHWADRMDLRERFLAEARMLRRASSSRVVQVFDIGELPDGRPYFVMEYADRGTLADRIEGGPLPLAQALQIAAEVGRGVAELHRAGIVHRDIKPSNVLIASAPDGGDRLLIADLGVAKSLAQASALTMSVGSAGYMAPEQAEPNSGVDVRADVYSVGAVAYRLITGVVPGLPGQVVPADRVVPGVPAPVSRTVQRAMEPARERRWPDTTTLAGRLDELAAQIRTRRPGRSGVRQLYVVLAAVVVLGLFGAGAAVLWSTRPVTVTDPQGPITLQVPRSWSAQLNLDGWNPAVMGLQPTAAGTLDPGLIVASDARRWGDLSAFVDGAFVGLSTDAELPGAVAAISHAGCHDAGILTYTGTRFAGPVHRWTSCPSGGGFAEAALTATPRGVYAYVQFRTSRDGMSDDRIVTVLGSLRAG